MRVFISIISLLFIIGCSAKVEKTTTQLSEKEAKKRDKQKEYAQQLFIDASLLDVEGKYAEAILDYQEALRLDPSAGIYYVIAKDYLRLNKFLPALENSRKSVELEGDNTEYLTLLGTIYQVSHNKDSAEVIFNKIIELDSTNVTALYNLAQLYEAKQPLKALESYKKVLDVTGSEWTVLFKIAEINERLGKVDETISTVEDLLELNPSNLQLKKLLIESYIKNDSLDNALEMVNDAIELLPDDLNLIELRGNAYIKKGLWSKGAEDYKKIISMKEISFQNKVNIGTAFYGEALNDSSVIPYAQDVLI